MYIVQVECTGQSVKVLPSARIYRPQTRQGRMLLAGLGCQVGDGRVAEKSSVGRGG